MSQIYGYIYIRNHLSYDSENACKLGKASNIPERDNQYATGEIKRGYFEEVFEVPFEITGNIERMLQNNFNNLNIKYDAGTEFYNKTIINLIEPYLITLNIKYRRLSKQEISELVRCNRENNSNVNNTSNKYTPRPDQNLIIEKSVTHFKQYNKGMLVLMCGVGKTLISLWIAQRLNMNAILIGVPNKLLLNQWKEKVKDLFETFPCLVVSGGVTVEDITKFLEKNNKKCIVITTYASSHKVYSAAKNILFAFDFKINDEVHHLTTNNMVLTETTKKYIEMLKIPSINQLSLTATLKLLENNEMQREDEITVSNDNIEYFGEIIDKKCLLWAINQKVICDYNIQTIIANEEQLEQQLIKFNITEENDKRLFLSAFTSLKSIFEGHSHHLLIYSNNKDNAIKIKNYIKSLMENKYFDINNIYYSDYHSEMNTTNQKEILNCFENANFGIITCVYCLGEGWDFPLLDAVVFAENMSSTIRIVQSALRASRKNKDKSNKKTNIILPILNRDDWLDNNENSDLKKVKEVIYQMGLEDETIAQKIRVCKIDFKPKPKPKPNPDNYEIINDFGEYDDELTQKLKLKTVKRMAFGITYEKAKKIIAEKNIKCKTAYFELCKKDFRLSSEPEVIFKGHFTNWINYLSIEQVYYDLETCKSKVNDYLLLHPELKSNHLELQNVCIELCKLDVLFPPSDLWIDYYNVKDLRDVITITTNKKKVSSII